MQTNETTRADQQAPEDASTAVADPTRRKPGRPPGSASKKKATKKKATKKKTSKKKATKKKAGKKKASKKRSTVSAIEKPSKKVSKKKASKKKRGKKKAAGKSAPSDSMTRLLAAVEELREAVVELAHEKAQEQQTAVSDLRQAAQARIADIEEMAGRALKKLGF